MPKKLKLIALKKSGMGTDAIAANYVASSTSQGHSVLFTFSVREMGKENCN